MFKIKQDKQLHILASALLMALLFMSIKSLVWAGLLAFAIGVLKELVYDKFMKKGTADVYDLVANGVGIFLMSVLILIFYGGKYA